jgi:hypothetical protein
MRGQLGLIVLGLWGGFRPVFRDRLRVADRFGQHQAQLILCLRRLPRGRRFPLYHEGYMGMPERVLNPRTPRTLFQATELAGSAKAR